MRVRRVFCDWKARSLSLCAFACERVSSLAVPVSTSLSASDAGVDVPRDGAAKGLVDRELAAEEVADERKSLPVKARGFELTSALLCVAF